MLITDEDVSTFLKQAILLVRFFVDVFDKDLKLREERSQKYLQKLEQTYRERDRAAMGVPVPAVPHPSHSSSSLRSFGTLSRGDTVVISPPTSPNRRSAQSPRKLLSQSHARGINRSSSSIDLTGSHSNEHLSHLSHAAPSSSSSSSPNRSQLSASHSSSCSSFAHFPSNPQNHSLLGQAGRSSSASSTQSMMECDLPSLSQCSVRSDDSCFGPPDFSKSLLAVLIRAAESTFLFCFFIVFRSHYTHRRSMGLFNLVHPPFWGDAA